MKRVSSLLIYSVCGSVIAVALCVLQSPSLSMTDVRDMFASVFFVDSITVADLKERYARAMRGGSRVRVLIVPGHDDRAWGTEFRGIREADMNAMVGEELSKFLSGDAAYEPILVRTSEGYVKEFQDYFDSEQKNVLEFLTEKKKIMRNLVRAGSVHTIDGVVHNSVPSEIAGRLYAINKWANEHAVDIVIHIHFNDYPGRPHTRPGRYNGFSLYVADPQFSNAKASKAVAGSLFEQLSKFYAESNLPVEDSGIVEDQELIAIGAYNTVDPASVLIEYGYIYEQQFLDSDIRAKVMRELAFQTYQGLNRFFGKYGELFQEYPTTLLPHAWERPLVQGSGANTEILSLQAALLLEDLYPPQGESKRDCPLTGSFGPCTARAVKLFQEKNGLPTSGTVGELTLAKLNEKYGR